MNLYQMSVALFKKMTPKQSTEELSIRALRKSKKIVHKEITKVSFFDIFGPVDLDKFNTPTFDTYCALDMMLQYIKRDPQGFAKLLQNRHALFNEIMEDLMEAKKHKLLDNPILISRTQTKVHKLLKEVQRLAWELDIQLYEEGPSLPTTEHKSA